MTLSLRLCKYQRKDRRVVGTDKYQEFNRHGLLVMTFFKNQEYRVVGTASMGIIRIQEEGGQGGRGGEEEKKKLGKREKKGKESKHKGQRKKLKEGRERSRETGHDRRGGVLVNKKKSY